MTADWLFTSWAQAGLVVLSAVVALISVITFIRIVGLRSLSKMSSFDFAVTVAIGSTIATTAATSTPLANGVLAVAALLATQACISWLRRRTRFQQLVDNQPTLLMCESGFLDDAMRSCRITRGDILAKLRQSNVMSFDDVRAVVLETTGDISVLHGSGPLHDELLTGVRLPSDPAQPHADR